jgi:hypothetical protein
LAPATAREARVPVIRSEPAAADEVRNRRRDAETLMVKL